MQKILSDIETFRKIAAEKMMNTLPDHIKFGKKRSGSAAPQQPAKKKSHRQEQRKGKVQE